MDLQSNCVVELFTAASLAAIYVILVRISSRNCNNRDEPMTIVRRAVGAFISCLISGYICSFWNIKNVPFTYYTGLKLPGLLYATFLPLMWTMVLFSGSIILHCVDGSVDGFLRDFKYWRTSFGDLCFWRNNLIAPVTEEWVFRACTLPILLYCYSKNISIFVGPLFFSLAHYHHIYEIRGRGYNWTTAILNCSFQAFYTYLFGVYASFLYIRTGHLVSAILCHSFCNHMGFPPFEDVLHLKRFQKYFVILSYVLGLSFWIYFLYPVTEPALYQNK